MKNGMRGRSTKRGRERDNEKGLRIMVGVHTYEGPVTGNPSQPNNMSRDKLWDLKKKNTGKGEARREV